MTLSLDIHILEETFDGNQSKDSRKRGVGKEWGGDEDCRVLEEGENGWLSQSHLGRTLRLDRF